MDRIDTMRTFALIVERRSFTKAAAALNLPRASVTHAIKRLEARLGARLLHRTTRTVVPTGEGEAYYERCVRLITDFDSAEKSVQERKPVGSLRIDIPSDLAPFLFPKLSEFVRAYPGIELDASDSGNVELIRGADCAIRAGKLYDSAFLTLPISTLIEATAASPGYCQRYGLPTNVDQLHAGHAMVGFFPNNAETPTPLQFQYDGNIDRITLPTLVKVRSADAYISAGLAGLGIIQAPRYRLEIFLATGQLIPLLDSFPPLPCPVSLLYAKTRLSCPALSAFISWVKGEVLSEDQRSSAAQ
jgi:DNA-binding transcriptional LysR family regulator